MKKIKTAQQIKAEFNDKGLTFSNWAQANGYRAQEVYRVLNGFSKGKYGRAHEIAVKLGLKSVA